MATIRKSKSRTALSIGENSLNPPEMSKNSIPIINAEPVKKIIPNIGLITDNQIWFAT